VSTMTAVADAVDAADLRHALDFDELRLHYLPIVEFGTGRVVGVEALVRWQRGPGDVLPPDAFLDLAERSGQLIELGRWVLEHALGDVTAVDPRLRLSVNLSLPELLAPQLPATVAAALAASGYPASGLHVEVSERSMTGDLGRVAAAMRRLKNLGVRLSVDDFGIGASSLAQLQRLPVDELKVDRSFVARMHDDRTSAALVRAIVSLARSLRLTTLAEGVETEAQERMLLGLRCTAAQGWLYADARPSVAEAIAAVDTEGIRRRTGPGTGALWSGVATTGVAASIVESAFAHAPIGMALVDGTGTQLAVNPALCHLLGAPAADLVGHSCWDAVHPDDVPDDQAQMDAVLRGETHGYVCEQRYVDRAGALHWVEVTVGGAPEETTGAVSEVRLLRQVRSIHDRRRAEERTAVLAAVVDASVDAIVIVGPEGVITHFNPGAERLTGWRAEEVVGRRGPQVLGLVDAVVAGHPVRLPHTNLVDRDGTTIPVDVTVSPFNTPDGPGTSFVAILRDIRQQVAAAEALEAQADDLTEANGRLRAFAHQLSHELQQPLTAVGGFLHLLDRAGGLAEEPREWLACATRGQRRLTEAVDALRLTAEGEPSALVPVDLDTLVDEVLEDLREVLDDAGATVHRPGPLPQAAGDIGVLRRVVTNLLTNACRYRRPDRVLAIAVEHHIEDGRVVVEVTDNGHGFAADELEKVFVDGHRGSAAVGRAGTGTGLAIVRAAIDQLDGEVWADHAPAGGARLCFSLRLAA
jgi:PAS domain S-box-containing protein